MATRLRIATFNLENLDDKPGQKPTLDQRIALLHVLVSRARFAYPRCAEVHNESMHDESSAFATDEKYPESDHAPVVAGFEIT